MKPLVVAAIRIKFKSAFLHARWKVNFFSNYLSLLFNFTQKSTNNAKNEYSQISHGIVLQKTGLTSFNPAQTCECQKREREYKLMLKIQQGRWKQTWSCVTQMVMAKIHDRKKIQSPQRNWTVITSSYFKKCGNLTW